MQMFSFQLILSLGFVGQWWCGYIDGDLCGGFWLIWVFDGGYGWLFWLAVVVFVYTTIYETSPVWIHNFLVQKCPYTSMFK